MPPPFKPSALVGAILVILTACVAGSEGGPRRPTPSRQFEGSTQVGQDNYVAVQTPDTDQAHATSNGTAVLFGQGELMIQGLFDFNDAHNVVAIIGGTGNFRGAKGEVDITVINATTTTVTFHLTA